LEEGKKDILVRETEMVKRVVKKEGKKKEIGKSLGVGGWYRGN
jgi:hypothetical protein